jgi:hypothetical protein
LFAIGSVLFVLAHDRMWQHAVFYTIVGAGTGLVIGSLPKLIADRSGGAAPTRPSSGGRMSASIRSC